MEMNDTNGLPYQYGISRCQLKLDNSTVQLFPSYIVKRNRIASLR